MAAPVLAACRHDSVLWLALQRSLVLAGVHILRTAASFFRRFEARLAAFSAKSREFWPFRLNFNEFRRFLGRLFAFSLEFVDFI